jgi:hypothetical protein
MWKIGQLADFLENFFSPNPPFIAAFERLPARFNKNDAERQSIGPVIYQFVLLGESGGSFWWPKPISWYVAIGKKSCSVQPGVHEASNFTIWLSAQDFLDLVSGKNMGAAFMSGKLQLAGPTNVSSGDIGPIVRFQSLFNATASASSSKQVRVSATNEQFPRPVTLSLARLRVLIVVGYAALGGYSISLAILFLFDLGLVYKAVFAFTLGNYFFGLSFLLTLYFIVSWWQLKFYRKTIRPEWNKMTSMIYHARRDIARAKRP